MVVFFFLVNGEMYNVAKKHWTSSGISKWCKTSDNTSDYHRSINTETIRMYLMVNLGYIRVHLWHCAIHDYVSSCCWIPGSRYRWCSFHKSNINKTREHCMPCMTPVTPSYKLTYGKIDQLYSLDFSCAKSFMDGRQPMLKALMNRFFWIYFVAV